MKKAIHSANKVSKPSHEEAKKQQFFLNNPSLMTARGWNQLGIQYHRGKDKKPKDYTLARYCFEKAILLDAKYSRAHYNLGLIYQYGRDVERDLKKAADYHTEASQQGYVGAIKQLIILENEETLDTADKWNDLGEKYYNQNETPQDRVKARVCYEQAIECGTEDANPYYSLGWFYHHYDEELGCDLRTAAYYYTEASQRGSVAATKQLIILENKETLDTADKWNDLGEKYYNQNETPQNRVKARVCYEQAIECGTEDANPYYSLGWFYHYGKELGCDLEKAAFYYTEASQRGNAEATKNLITLENGEVSTSEEWGVLGTNYHSGSNERSQNDIKAKFCYEQAVALDQDKRSPYYHPLGQFYEKEDGRLEKAIEYYLIAIQQNNDSSSEAHHRLLTLAKVNNPDAQYAMGQLLKNGAEEKDEIVIDWIKEAIKNWNRLAKEALASVSSNQPFTEKMEIYRGVISQLKKSINSGSKYAKQQLGLVTNQLITSLLYHALRQNIRGVSNLKAKPCESYLQLLILIDIKYGSWDAEKFKKYIEQEETSKHTYFGTDLSDEDDSDLEEEQSFQRCSSLTKQSALIYSRGFWKKANLWSATLTLDGINKETKTFGKNKPVLTPTEKIGKYSESTDQILKDLRELNYWRNRGDLTEGLKRSHRTQFAIAQYRGITYKVTDWGQSARRSHRQRVEVGAPLFSSSVYKEAKLPYTIDCQQNAEAKATLKNYAIKLKKHLIVLRRKNPNVKKYGSKELPEYRFDSIADRLQNEYTLDYDKFGAILAAKKIKCEKNSFLSFSLLNASNPFISTGDIPLHALKYAYGIKPYQGHEHERLRPRWRKDENKIIGRAERPYSGKTYVTLHTIKEYDEDKPIHVVSYNHLGKLRINDNPRGFQIINERETTFPAYLPEGRIIYTHVAKYPSFNGPYKEIYAIKYGIDEEFYGLFQQALKKFPPHSKELEWAKILLGEYLCHYHQFRLIDVAQQKAAQRRLVLVYVDEFGNLGLNLPFLPASASKKDPHDLNNLRNIRSKRTATQAGLQDETKVREESKEDRPNAPQF